MSRNRRIVTNAAISTASETFMECTTGRVMMRADCRRSATTMIWTSHGQTKGAHRKHGVKEPGCPPCCFRQQLAPGVRRVYVTTPFYQAPTTCNVNNRTESARPFSPNDHSVARGYTPRCKDHSGHRDRLSRESRSSYISPPWQSFCLDRQTFSLEETNRPTRIPRR